MLLPMQTDQEAVNRWRSVAPFWEKHRKTVRQMFAPVTSALVEDGLIGGGQTVLDVGTGPGEPALAIAALAGADGKLCGIDPAPEMVEAARREADRLELRNAQFTVASADHLPFPADTFDAAISRFGAMFFPAPVEAAREILRVLKPGGKLAFAVWGYAEDNPFFYTIARVIEQYVGSPPPEPGAPDPFRFACEGTLREILVEAGAVLPSERLLRFAMEAPLSAEDFLTLRIEMSETLQKKVAMLSVEQMAGFKAQVIEGFGAYTTGNGMSFPAQVLIVSGSKGRE
jgi:ubiquinone/menaquinone biosynthesis C-methylase UbiE